MKNNFKISLVVLLFCAVPMLVQSVDAKTTVSSRQQDSQLEQKKKDRENKRFERDRALVLQKKSEILSQRAIPSRAYPQSKKLELLSPSSPKIDDKALYSQIVAKFERNEEFGFFSRAQGFVERFPKSPLADEVIYLSGMMHLNQKRFGKAILDFNKILKDYPRSNKAVSAQFAKAVTYRRMNLPQQAKSVFGALVKRYPGSPEAFRAQVELKTMN